MFKIDIKSLAKLSTILLLLGLLAACSNSQTKENVDNDPYESLNRISYDFNETLDQSLVKPIAVAYVGVTPLPVRNSVTNFFDNITYLNVILNAILQGKFDQALTDSLRFVYNSTVGIAGLFDVSTAIGMPKHNEDLGQTLAVWGVSQGAYMYIPLSGPETSREFPDIISSTLLNPITYVTGTVLFPLTAVNIINRRADLLDATKFRDEAALDPYSFTREAYLQQRQNLIYDGNPPIEDYDDIFDEEFESDSGTLIIE